MGDEVGAERGKAHIRFTVSIKVDVHIIRVATDTAEFLLSGLDACEHRILRINAKALSVVSRIFQHVSAEPVVQEDRIGDFALGPILHPR